MIRRLLFALAAGIALWLLQPAGAANACSPSYQGQGDSSLQSCPQEQPEWAAGVLASIAGVAAVSPLLLGLLRLARAGGSPGKVIPLGQGQFRLGNPGRIKTIGRRVLDPGFLGAPPGMPQAPPGGAAYNPVLAEQVQQWGLNDVKTRGLLLRGDGTILPLQSGRSGPAQFAAGGTGTGLSWSLRTHVEAHAGSALQPGEHGTLYLNRVPCGLAPGSPAGCQQNLPRYVPPGARLTVYGPDGYARLVIGGAP